MEFDGKYRIYVTSSRADEADQKSPMKTILTVFNIQTLQEWRREINDAYVKQHLIRIIEVPEELRFVIKNAIDNSCDNVELVIEQETSDGELRLIIKTKNTYSTFQNKDAIISLLEVEQNDMNLLKETIRLLTNKVELLSNRLEVLEMKQNLPTTAKKFQFDVNKIGANLMISEDRQCIGKMDNGWSTGLVVDINGKLFRKGRHILKIQIIKTASDNNVMVGIMPPGGNYYSNHIAKTSKDGVTIHCHKGRIYGSGSDKGLFSIGGNSIIETVVDFDRNTIEWVANGIRSSQRTFPKGEYYFGVSLYNKGDFVKIV